MSTYMAKPAEIERKWYIIDAAGKPLGRVAVQAADLLRGKLKTTYTPQASAEVLLSPHRLCRPHEGYSL